MNFEGTNAHTALNALDKVEILIYSDANLEKQQHEMLFFFCVVFISAGAQRDANLHSGLHGSYAQSTRRSGESIPEPHHQGFHLGEMFFQNAFFLGLPPTAVIYIVD